MIRLAPLILASAFLISACTSAFERPRNYSDMDGMGYMPERQYMTPKDEPSDHNRPRSSYRAMCAVETPKHHYLRKRTLDEFDRWNMAEVQTLSGGDFIRLDVRNSELMSGDYSVLSDGTIRLPHVRPISVAGLDAQTASRLVSQTLERDGFMHVGYAHSDVSVLKWGEIEVFVSGAVFQPGPLVINSTSGDKMNPTMLDSRGDAPLQRQLSSALRSASGVRPDADLSQVTITNAKGVVRRVNLSGILEEKAINDPFLVAGDQIFIPSKKCFQPELARPTRLTLPGIRVYMSNLIRPAFNNASAAIGRDTQSLPYGTTFLQSLVAANCVGGTQATNAQRWGVLISKNPYTGESEVIARSVEELVRRADRDQFNPVLMPYDAIACYDSHNTNVRDVIAMVSESLAPISFGLLYGRE